MRAAEACVGAGSRRVFWVMSSGSIAACEALEEIAKPEFKARMTVRLAVAGAFHTKYMSPAVASLEEALASTSFSTPRIPVVSNVDAMPHSDPDTIKQILAKQVGRRARATCQDVVVLRVFS